jgi:Fe-S cluster assembly protein SufD
MTVTAMSQVMQAHNRYVADFDQVQAALAGQGIGWVQRLRREALARFTELGFPTTRDEDWKYTQVTPIERGQFRFAETPEAGAPGVALASPPYPGLVAHRVVFLNGHYVPRLSDLQALPAGAFVDSLAHVLEQRPERVEPHLAQYADWQAHAFTALNTAFMTDGAVIYLPRNTVLEHPIHLVFLSSSREQPLVAHPRNLVIAAENSQAVIIESYEGPDDSGYFTNAVTEVVAGENAIIEHYKLQQEGAKALHVATLQVQQARDSQFTSHSISLGSLLARNDINAWLNDAGAECTLNGLYLAGGRQHMDYHTRIDHARPHGTSREFYKGVLDGRSRGVFNGRVIVHPGAQKTDAQQVNKNLLLSEDAEVDPKPQLEIFADDVKCSHGATVGTLDSDALFYLRSRGVDAESAKGILIYAFANDVIERIRLAPLRTRLEAMLLARLPQGQGVQELMRHREEVL